MAIAAIPIPQAARGMDDALLFLRNANNLPGLAAGLTNALGASRGNAAAPPAPGGYRAVGPADAGGGMSTTTIAIAGGAALLVAGLVVMKLRKKRR